MAIGNIYLISTVAVLGGALFGFDIASMSAILGIEQYNCYFDQSGDGSCTGPRADVQGGITASMAGGSWLGSLASGLLSDSMGRRSSLMAGCAIWCIGSIIVCACQNIPMLVVGRIINGFAVGICSAQVPVYISETAPPSKRGSLIAGQEWAITWGIAIMFYISYGCSFLEGTKAFRVPWGLQMIPAVFMAGFLWFLPESPRWYAQKDRWEECHEVLALVHGNRDRNHPVVQKEMEEIKAAAQLERQQKEASYLDLFKPHLLWRTHVGVFCQIWSQLTGVNVMMYYITYVFKMANLTGNTLLLSSSIEYVINVLMVIPAMLWADAWGRRRSMIAGAAVMGTCMFANGAILAVYGTYAGPEGVDNTPAASTLVTGPASKAVIALSYIFTASFAPTWGPVSWTYPAELFPLHLRGKGMALCTSANWAFNFALGYFVPPAFVKIRWATYILFGVFNVLMAVHAYLCFPETAGKTLEDVDLMFNDPSGLPYIGTPAWRTSKGKFEVLDSQAFDEAKAESMVVEAHPEKQPA